MRAPIEEAGCEEVSGVVVQKLWSVVGKGGEMRRVVMKEGQLAWGRVGLVIRRWDFVGLEERGERGVEEVREMRERMMGMASFILWVGRLNRGIFKSNTVDEEANK